MDSASQELPSLSNEEINDLRRQMRLLDRDLKNPEEMRNLVENPVVYLTSRDIAVMRHINADPATQYEFNVTVKKMLVRKPLWNKCLSCKIAVLLMIFALLGKVMGAWALLLAGINGFIEAVREYFGDTGTRIEGALKTMTTRTEDFSPPTLALKICRLHGYCPTR